MKEKSMCWSHLCQGKRAQRDSGELCHVSLKRLQLLKGLQISADIGNAVIEVTYPFSRSFSSYLHMEVKSSFILFFLIEHIH